MGDVRCLNCGEPWDAYELRHGDTREALEDEGFVFGKSVLLVKRCPCCPKETPLRDSIRRQKRMEAEIAEELLGDDEDGLQSLLEE